MSGAVEATPADEPSWEQGSLLPSDVAVSPLQWIHPDEPATKATRGVVKAQTQRDGPLTAPFPGSVAMKQGDRLMVITQTCDIIKQASDLPQIEVARVFTTRNRPTIVQAQDFGSARFFRVDSGEDEAVILDYGQRALLDKGFVVAVIPDNRLRQTWSSHDAKALARWLGQRYSRPAIPDKDYEEITRPVREAWMTLVKEQPETAASYNREYAEWRYRREKDGSLTLYLLSSKPEPDETTALELIDFLTQTIEPAYLGEVHVATDHRSYHTFTKADELSTEQISMEWASRDEDDGDTAMPA